MHFFIRCVDKPGQGQVRAANRERHLEYLQRHAAQIVAAGPTLSEDGATMTGSVLLMEFADRQAAEAFCREDPYAKAGLFAEVTVTPWRRVFPQA